MDTNHLYILLADDDEDDCLFFKESLNELPLSAQLTVVNDGEQLIDLLTEEPLILPHVLFLDLNMPKINGYECLLKIKTNEQLKQLPVVILSTYFDREIASRLYKNGAMCCIRKPAVHSELKRLIQQVLSLIAHPTDLPLASDKFVLIE